MLASRVRKESSRLVHRESWHVHPRVHAHGRSSSETDDQFDEVLTLMNLDADVVLAASSCGRHSPRQRLGMHRCMLLPVLPRV